ncbi:MAG: nuclear transport factor 2 family protein [Actinomycetes bacterium]
MSSTAVDRYRQAMELFARGDDSGLEASLADDVVWHEAGSDEVVRGKQAVMQRMARAYDVRPDITLRSVLGDDEHLAVHGHARFTRDGEWCEYDFVEEMDVRDGRVVERWSYMDAVPDDVARFFARR